MRPVVLVALFGALMVFAEVVPLNAPPPIDLRKTRELVFRSGTKVPRLSGPALDALRCEGKHCSHVSVPETITCVNRFEGTILPTWDCTGVLEGGYRLGRMRITCEEHPTKRDAYIADSCRLVYTLTHPDPSVEAHDDTDDMIGEDAVARKELAWCKKVSAVLSNVITAVFIIIVCVAIFQGKRKPP